MRVAVANRYPGLRVPAGAVQRLFSCLDLSTGPSAAQELSVVFMTDAELARLHGEFLQDPSITDVITFPGMEDSGILGEVCVSVDAALRVGGARGFARELTLYLVHGWLHLGGYDDLQPELKRRMRRAEQRAMARLATEGAMPRFTLSRRRR